MQVTVVETESVSFVTCALARASVAGDNTLQRQRCGKTNKGEKERYLLLDIKPEELQFLAG